MGVGGQRGGKKKQKTSRAQSPRTYASYPDGSIYAQRVIWQTTTFAAHCASQRWDIRTKKDETRIHYILQASGIARRNRLPLPLARVIGLSACKRSFRARARIYIRSDGKNWMPERLPIAHLAFFFKFPFTTVMLSCVASCYNIVAVRITFKSSVMEYSLALRNILCGGR